MKSRTRGFVRPRILLWVMSLVLFSLLSSRGVASSPLLRVGGISFDPLQWGEIPGEKTAPSKAGRYWIVQFQGPVVPEDRAALRSAGAQILDYIPDFAFVVRMDPTKVAALGSISRVRWVGPYLPRYRRPKDLEARLMARGLKEADLIVIPFPGEDLEGIRRAVEDLGGKILMESRRGARIKLRVRITPGAIGSLCETEGIRWVEAAPQWRLFNNVSTDILGVRSPRDNHGLYGRGQVVGIADTGLDQGSIFPALLHDDFEDGRGRSRVIRIFDVAGDGDPGDSHGHGTHVAGSVLGNGILSGSDPRNNIFPPEAVAGMAPKANLIFQAIMDNATGGLAVPLDLGDLFEQAQSSGANLHTDSWGSLDGSQYTSFSEDVDRYIWEHKDFLVLFSAGNEGADLDGDGIIDYYSVASPATAKNCLSIGATEGDRPSGDGAIDATYGDLWPWAYPEDPIYSDHISDNPSGMAAFSSRGPTIDGRYKPDLVAPGTNILSTRSSRAPDGNFWGTYGEHYAWMGGTSMSAPLAAGTAALVREYLTTREGFSRPSAALIKAVLINAAEDISPGQYGSGDAQEIPDPPVPNPVEGWGRINLEKGVFPQGGRRILYLDETVGLQTGERAEYPFKVISGDSPLKVSLVWTDYPATPTACGGLVNDLDLELVDPQGVSHYPDNRVAKGKMEALVVDDEQIAYYYSRPRVAVKLTPSSYPATVEAVSFMFYNPYHLSGPILIKIYDDDGPSGGPGTELFSTSLNSVGSLTWITIPIGGVSIPDGSLYASVEYSPTTSFGQIGSPLQSGRGWAYDGSSWTTLDSTPLIRGFVRGPDPSTPFDRVNNTVGITVQDPDEGTWRMRVHGYNVPYGPQPYAVVISGALGPHAEPDSGGPGVKVTITGMDFGTRRPKVYFYRGDLRKRAKVVAYDRNRVVCRFPTEKLYTAGLYGIEVRNRTTKTIQRFDDLFELLPPQVLGADKTEVTWKDLMTLTGRNFGTRRGKVWFEGVAPLDKTKRAKVRKSNWTDDQVTLRVPKGLPSGDYRVKLENRVGQSYLATTVRVTAP